MNKVLELFGHSTHMSHKEWGEIVEKQHCPFLGRRCFKVRKSDPRHSIGTCNVLYGKDMRSILICPARLIERQQIFSDCLSLLTDHEPGNEYHLVPEVSIPGGSVDYFLVSLKENEVRDFVGIELQTLDTTGTVWPERQRLLQKLGVPRSDGAEKLKKPFGMNWKMTTKTILVQMHHKIETFEYLNKKLVLVVQDHLLDYMRREFQFSHMQDPVTSSDSMRLHAYRVDRQEDNTYRLKLDSMIGTNAEGIKVCLGLEAEPRIGLKKVVAALEQKISPQTLFTPIQKSASSPALGAPNQP